jgi:drug/metabolite transporter (DMT)-like permease
VCHAKHTQLLSSTGNPNDPYFDKNPWHFSQMFDSRIKMNAGTKQAQTDPMKKFTTLGILAILFWSTNVAFSRSLAEQIGLLTSGAAMFGLSGIVSIAYGLVRGKTYFSGPAWSLKGSQGRYLLICGPIFVVNTIALVAAVGLAANHTQVIAVGLLNYLWTVFSLVFSVPILKKHGRALLPAGILLALGGMYLAATNGQPLQAGEILTDGHTLVVYGLALLAALTWGFYSNLSRKWAPGDGDGAVPVFMLASGILMGLARLWIPEPFSFTAQTGIELAYMVIVPTMLAFIFWDAAMRGGNLVLVVSLSYFIPVLSTIVSSFKLSVPVSLTTWLAAGLIMLGALICNQNVKD